MSSRVPPPRPWLLGIGMVGAVGAVFLLAYADQRRERARAHAEFASREEAFAKSMATTLAARLDAVGASVRAVAAALDRDTGAPAPSGGFAAVVRGILADGRLYQTAEIVAPDGQTLLRLAAGPARYAASPPLAALRDATVSAAARASGVVISGPVTPEPALATGRAPALRLFALRAHRGTVLFSIVTEPLYASLAPPAEADDASDACWIVLDDADRLIRRGVGRCRLEDALPRADDASPLDALPALFRQLGARATGSAELPRQVAALLGLVPSVAVAGFAPVPLEGGRPWSLALVSSARRLRHRDRSGVGRLAAATGLAALLTGLFGLITARHERRAQALAQALQVAEATAALRERSAKAVEALPVGVLALDAALEVTSANPFLVERGVAARGPLVAALPHARRDELDALVAIVAAAHASGRPAEHLGLRLHLGGPGEVREVDAYAVALSRPHPDGEAFLVLHDRTQERALERDLVRAEKLATVGTLTAGVAHEIGTPLGVISGRAEQLLSRAPAGEGGEAMRKGLTSILTQVDKVSTILRQLLDFARVRPVIVEAVRPAEALDGAAVLLEHRFRRAGVTLLVEDAAGVPSVAADPGQLEQVLVNLFLNACDACPPGAEVRARARAAADTVTLEVQDTGSGIAPEQLPSVLDPFFTTKKRGHGTGLGLTIAADIVKNHRGTLAIESALGRGTTVRVTLPRHPEDPPCTSPPS